mmetsp:Transcript_7284/g.17270  ORF Transcript_7284/g.17270 Transcript_7284/m.17270 type:complete len:252 (+) Transcript_7284:116-871(+)
MSKILRPREWQRRAREVCTSIGLRSHLERSARQHSRRTKGINKQRTDFVHQLAQKSSMALAPWHQTTSSTDHLFSPSSPVPSWLSFHCFGSTSSQAVLVSPTKTKSASSSSSSADRTSTQAAWLSQSDSSGFASSGSVSMSASCSDTSSCTDSDRSGSGSADVSVVSGKLRACDFGGEASGETVGAAKKQAAAISILSWFCGWTSSGRFTSHRRLRLAFCSSTESAIPVRRSHPSRAPPCPPTLQWKRRLA